MRIAPSAWSGLLGNGDALKSSGPVVRARVGNRLAQLVTPRFFGPERFYLPADDSLGFVRIPADPDSGPVRYVSWHEADRLGC